MSDELKPSPLQQLEAARKTIAILMERVEHAIDTAGSLHNLFEDNLQLKKTIDQHLRNEEELKRFNRALEAQVAVRTRELEKANLQLNENNAYLKELVRRDGLTGLFNHSAMMEVLLRRVAEAGRYNLLLSVVILDLDHFKKVNDTYGHQFGDHVLRIVAKTLGEAIRPVDYACRFGGEEFVLLLPNTSKEGARITAERVRTKIEGLKWEHRDLTTTISAGIASCGKDSAKSLIARADKRLYMAKKLGRNRVISSG